MATLEQQVVAMRPMGEALTEEGMALAARFARQQRRVLKPAEDIQGAVGRLRGTLYERPILDTFGAPKVLRLQRAAEALHRAAQDFLDELYAQEGE